MLGRRLCVVAALLMACGEEEPGEHARDADVRTDASTADGKVSSPPDGGLTGDAGASEDASAREDASIGEDASAPTTEDASVALNWRDQPEGNAAPPREVCSHRWEVAARAQGTHLVSDASGNLIVVGFLNAEQDFGAGALKPPAGDERLTTFVLKLDPACNLLWSRAFPPAEDMIERHPIGLGVDDAQRITLVTESSRYTKSGLDRFYDESRLDLSLLAPDGSESSRKTFSARYGSPATGSVQTNWHGITLIVNSTSQGSSYDFGAGLADARRGGMVNVLLRTDGSLIYSKIYGDVGANSGPGEWLGPQGDLYAAGFLSSEYYGQKLEGAVTLMKIDVKGKLTWKKELHPRVELPHSYIALGVADDGSFALWDDYATTLDGARTASFRAFTSSGDAVWEMPTVLSKRGGFLPLFVRDTARSIAVYGSLGGLVRLGNVTLDSHIADPMIAGEFVAQLEHGGATRWALAVPLTQAVIAVDTTPTDEVAALLTESSTLIISKLAR